MGRFAVVTVVTRNYLQFAQALGVSVKEHCPDADFFVCLADHPGNSFRPPFACDGWLDASEMGIPQWRRFAFQYTPFELSCALKPHALLALLAKGYERVAYCDSDMQIYRPLDELHEWLNASSIVLTPHALQPVGKDADLDECLFLRAGIFNAGFLAVSRTPVTQQFLVWWSQRVAQQCIDDQQNGLFVDQKWLDLVPGMFPGVHISRHFGYNAGHWTLMQVAPEADVNDTVRFGGDALAIWHFSGFQAAHPRVLCRWLPRCTADRYPAITNIAADYAKRLIDCADGQFENTSAFATLSDGTPIKRTWREAIRINLPELAEIADPFDATATSDLVQKFQQVEGSLASALIGRTAGQDLRDGVSQDAAAVKRKSWGKELERLVRRVRDQSLATCAKYRDALQPQKGSKERLL